MKIIVASTNPVKINSAKNGFQKIFPKKKILISGESLPSCVSDQPMSEEETMQGSFNRAKNAREKFPEAEYWVGIEGGVVAIEGKMLAFAWVTILSDKNIGQGRSASFFLPGKIANLVKNGKELGVADDIVFGRQNSKQESGTIGSLTKDAITRTTLYEPAVIIALIPFINPGLY